MLAIKTTTTPTLVSGAFDVTFGQFEKVDKAVAFTDLPATGGDSYQCKTAVSGNVVTVTVYKVTLTEATDGSRVYAAAETADLDAKTVTVIANGY